MQIHTTIQQANMYQIMFEELPVAVALTTNGGDIVYTNKEFSNLTGCRSEQLKNQAIDLFFRCRDDRAGSIAEVFDKTGEVRSEIGDRYLHTETENLDLKLIVNRCGQHLCFTIKDPVVNNNIRSADQSAKNTSSSSEVNLRMESLNQANLDLKRSNQALSQYAYVASHDLQEPLRKIRIYGDMLNAAEKVGAKEKFLVAKINAASQRMSILITDLLNYSRLLKPDDDLEPVDLQDIIHDVITDFEVAIQERKAVIKLTGLPVIQAVRLQMNQLFFNLLGNALKFTVPGEAPRVEISSRLLSKEEAGRHVQEMLTDRDYIQIRFIDHGIGFKANQAEEIFEVFKRLYTRDTYQGSGIGLALCRRIVQNHNGALYATSAPGKGSEFNIVLPV